MRKIGILMLFLIAGCDMVRHDCGYFNIYYDHIMVDSKDEFTMRFREVYTHYNNRMFLRIYHYSEFCPSHVVQDVKFYYKDKSCLLFSYTKEDIINIIEKSGFSVNKPKGWALIIDKDGLKIISVDELLKAKINSHLLTPEEMKTICKADSGSLNASTHQEVVPK